MSPFFAYLLLLVFVGALVVAIAIFYARKLLRRKCCLTLNVRWEQVIVGAAAFTVILILGAKAPLFGDDCFDPLIFPLLWRNGFAVPYFMPIGIFVYYLLYLLVGLGPIYMYVLIMLNAILASLVIAHAWGRVRWLALLPLSIPLVPYIYGSPYLVAGLATVFGYFSLVRFRDGDEVGGFLLGILATYTREELILIPLFYLFLWLLRRSWSKTILAALLIPYSLFVYAYSTAWLHPHFDASIIHTNVFVHIFRAFMANILAVAADILTLVPIGFIALFAFIGNIFSYVGGEYFKQYVVASLLLLPVMRRMDGRTSFVLFVSLVLLNCALLYAAPQLPSLYRAVYVHLAKTYAQTSDIYVAAFARGVYPRVLGITATAPIYVLSGGRANVVNVVDTASVPHFACKYNALHNVDYIVCDRFVREVCGCNYGPVVQSYGDVFIVLNDAKK